ncbi:unnamed protein product, partial [Ectocarpus sp. 4 AP-2014]
GVHRALVAASCKWCPLRLLPPTLSYCGTVWSTVRRRQINRLVARRRKEKRVADTPGGRKSPNSDSSLWVSFLNVGYSHASSGANGGCTNQTDEGKCEGT